MRLAIAIHGKAAALESAIKHSNNPSLVARLAKELGELKRQQDVVRRTKELADQGKAE